MEKGRYFDHDLVNEGRQKELDIVRGLAVIFMILVHFQIYYIPYDYMGSSWAYVIYFLGTVPCASVFMFVLGVGFVYSKNRNPERYILRGVKLFLFGYILSFARNFLPWFIMNASEGYAMNKSDIFDQIFYTDILQFAGLAMITLGLIAKWQLNSKKIIMILVILCILNVGLLNIHLYKQPWADIAGLLWGTNESSFFPYLTWILYPVSGYLFGNILKHCKNKDIIYNYFILAGGFIWFFYYFIVLGIFNIDVGVISEELYYHHTIKGYIVITAFNMFWIGMFYYAGKIMPQFIHKFLYMCSENVTQIYVSQWIVVGWMVIILGYNNLNPPFYFMLYAGVIVISIILGYALKQNWLTYRIKELENKAIKKIINKNR